MLVKAGPAVLPAVREALHDASPTARRRLIEVLAWQGDEAALPLLRECETSDPQDKALLHWAIDKIVTLEFVDAHAFHDER